jgi:predicted nucleotidyltransferase
MQDILEYFTQEIKNVFGDRLKAIVLYGSKASGEDAKINSDHNILVIVDKITLDKLALLAPATKKWAKAGNPPPMIFTTEEFATSTDVFPVEFLDMKDGSKLLAGEDILLPIKVEESNLRHEIEFDLRSKLLKLRQGYLVLHGDAKALRMLLLDSISSILVIFRHAVALFGRKRPLKKIDSLDILSEISGLKRDVFVTIYDMKHGNKEALKKKPDALMREYMEGIEKIIKTIDSL